jgi:hypothetical protein
VRAIGRGVASAALAGALCAGTVAANVRSAGNDILTLEIEDAGFDAGQFSLRTGARHPAPGRTVFFPIGTSYVTLRDETAQVIHANSGGGTFTNVAPLAFETMPPPAIVPIVNGFRTTYALQHWTVVQETSVAGTTLDDTRLRHSVTVTNASAVPRAYGMRFLWDWHIADDAITPIRTRPGDAPFRLDFFAATAPAFVAFEISDDAPTPTLSAFGTVRPGPTFPPPTPPDRFGYVAWEDFWPAPWDFPVSGGSGDSATVFYWGYPAPLTLAPGASATFTQYVTTHAGTAGAIAMAGPLAIPVVPWPAAAALAVLVAAFGAPSMRIARRTSRRARRMRAARRG